MNCKDCQQCDTWHRLLDSILTGYYPLKYRILSCVASFNTAGLPACFAEKYVAPELALVCASLVLLEAEP